MSPNSRHFTKFKATTAFRRAIGPRRVRPAPARERKARPVGASSSEGHRVMSRGSERQQGDSVSRCGGGRSHKLLALFGLLCFASLLVLLALRAMLAVLY